jgi:hypothetical protein
VRQVDRHFESVLGEAFRQSWASMDTTLVADDDVAPEHVSEEDEEDEQSLMATLVEEDGIL